MIKFFRRIRKKLLEENRLSKYLVYAGGEIVLVMIGILLALQVNNWNETRKAKLNEVAKLNNLLEDLILDSIAFDKSIKTLSEINDLHQQLYDIEFKGSKQPLTEDPNNIRRFLTLEAPSLKTSPLLTSQLNNEIIRKELIDYNEVLNLGRREMNEFVIIVKDKIRPYLGQKGVYNLSGLFETPDVNKVNMITKEDLVKISKNTDFQQVLFEANYKVKSTMDGIKNKLLRPNRRLRNLIINELKNY